MSVPTRRSLGVNMIRPHMRDLPEAEFPAGYGIRPMSTHDIGLWTDIQRDAEPFFEIRDSLFVDEFGSDLPAIAERCYIITGPKRMGVGTLSAWYNPNFRGLDYGRIHWVAVRPAYQRRGLARAGMAYAMRRLSECHERSYLVTSIQRPGAIRLYLDFGFVPDLEPPDARELWTELSATLDHPALRAALA